MKNIILILISILIASSALALDDGSFSIKVTINKGPSIDSFEPEDGYRIREGDRLDISVTATDPNNDALQYQFIINGIIKRPWNRESSYSYTLTQDDIGINRIKAEVTDGMETIQTEEVEIFVFRKSLELPEG